MKVLFVLPRMVMGGVERITLNLIRSFQTEGIECALALRKSYGELLHEATSVTEVHEIAGRSIFELVPRLAALMRKFEPTHVIVVFSDLCLLTLISRACSLKKISIVCGVHNSHGIETARVGFWGRIRYALDYQIAKVIYRWVDAIVTDSRGVESEIRSLFHVQGDHLSTIYNPVMTIDEIAEVSAIKTTQSSPIALVAIGRFVRQKGFDILIEAMALLKSETLWRLNIFGDGPDRSMLERIILEHRLNDRIFLHGYVADPINCLSDAEVFILSSRHEGLPTILIQALSLGMPIVATDCPYGPKEILDNGRLGILVRPNDAQDLAAGIDIVLSGQYHADFASMRKYAQRFSTEKTSKLWCDLLRRLENMSCSG